MGEILKYTAMVLTPLFLILAGSFLWSWSLKRKVAQKTEELGIEIEVRKRTEELLRESEEKYRSMMESMDACVYICSPVFRVEYMNSAMIRRTGQDAIGEPCHKAIHSLEEKCPWCNHEKIQKGGTCSKEIVSPKDNRSYHASSSPIYHVDGSISKMSIYTDITERRQAVEEYARLSAVIEQAAETVVVMVPDGTIQYINPATENIIGYKREEVIGKNAFLTENGIYDSQFYQEVWKTVSRGDSWTGHLTYKKKDGTPCEFWQTVSPIYDKSGNIINLASIGRDITNELRLESALMHAQKMEAIGTLAGGIAHDFNNILALYYCAAGYFQQYHPVTTLYTLLLKQEYC